MTRGIFSRYDMGQSEVIRSVARNNKKFYTIMFVITKGADLMGQLNEMTWGRAFFRLQKCSAKVMQSSRVFALAQPPPFQIGRSSKPVWFSIIFLLWTSSGDSLRSFEREINRDEPYATDETDHDERVYRIISKATRESVRVIGVRSFNIGVH